MLFFSILNLKIHSIKPSKCYKICNTTTVHFHFWERIVVVLYNILLIYLFSLSSSLSPTSLSFSGFLSVSHISLISSLSLSHTHTTRSYVWDRLRGKENGVMVWDWCGGDQRGDRCGDRRVVCFLVVVVASVLWFLWQFFVVFVVVVSCCDWSCGCNVWWVLVVLGVGFGWGWDRAGGFWLGLRSRWWVLVGVENEVGGWWWRWVAVAEVWVLCLMGFSILRLSLSSTSLSSSSGEASLS